MQIRLLAKEGPVDVTGIWEANSVRQQYAPNIIQYSSTYKTDNRDKIKHIVRENVKKKSTIDWLYSRSEAHCTGKNVLQCILESLI